MKLSIPVGIYNIVRTTVLDKVRNQDAILGKDVAGYTAKIFQKKVIVFKGPHESFTYRWKIKNGSIILTSK